MNVRWRFVSSFNPIWKSDVSKQKVGKVSCARAQDRAGLLGVIRYVVGSSVDALFDRRIGIVISGGDPIFIHIMKTKQNKKAMKGTRDIKIPRKRRTYVRVVKGPGL